MPSARSVVLPRVMHLPPLEEPLGFNAEQLSFL
jgi:hypothetical protein